MHITFRRKPTPKEWVPCFVLLPKPTVDGLVWLRCERKPRYCSGEYGTAVRNGWYYRPRGSSYGTGADELIATAVWLVEIAAILLFISLIGTYC